MPWVLSLAIVGYVINGIGLESLGEKIMMADISRLVVVVTIMTVLVFLADTATLYLLIRRFLATVSIREMLAMKSVSYFFNAINYSAGSGAVAYFLKKKRGVGFLEGVSALLWLNFIDVLVLLAMLAAGLVLSGDLLPAAQREGLPFVLLLGVGIAAGALAYWQIGLDFLVLGRFRSWRLFQVFREATWRDIGVMMGARALFICLYVLLNWLALPCFGLDISLAALLVYTPLLTFLQIVPLSVSGLGAIQVAMVILYGHYLGGGAGVEAQIYAFSFVIGPLTSLIRMGIGYLFVGHVARDFLPSAEELALAANEEEPTEPASS